MELGLGPEKPVKLYPEDGLFGLRVGISSLKPVNYIDIFGHVYDGTGRSYHLHFNFANKRTRLRKLGNEGVLNIVK